MPRLPLSLLLTPLLLGPAALASASPLDGPPIPADTEIVTTASGLKYSVLKPGTGQAPPKPGDRVKVHYSGWLADGTLFDSSRQRGTPSEFGVGDVIEGLNEALVMLSPGAQVKLTIPSELAYGVTGRPPKIPANTDLIYELELLAITAVGPEFIAFDEAGATTTASGLAWKTVEEGAGPAIGLEGQAWLEYAMWDEAGKFYLSSTVSQAPLIGVVGELPYAVLREGVALLSEGQRVVIKAPPELAFGDRTGRGLPPPNSTTIWQLRLMSTFQAPAFELPPDSELETTPFGVQYKILRLGSGQPGEGANEVLTHYAGWLTDGTPIDSSYDRGQPLQFRMDGVIAGWGDGMTEIYEGGKVLLVIPPDMGYGERGNPPIVPPNSTLVFVIELLRVLS